jgi:hypothetical protein
MFDGMDGDGTGDVTPMEFKAFVGGWWEGELVHTDHAHHKHNLGKVGRFSQGAPPRAPPPPPTLPCPLHRRRLPSPPCPLTCRPATLPVAD